VLTAVEVPATRRLSDSAAPTGLASLADGLGRAGRTSRPYEEYQFCKQFVIETALHLAELDFDLNLYDMYLAHRRRQQIAAAGTGPATP